MKIQQRGVYLFCIVFCATLSLFFSCLLAIAQEKNAPEERSKAYGPVPAYKAMRKVKKLSETVYYDITWPQFGNKALDAIIQESLSEYLEEAPLATLSIKKDQEGVVLPHEQILSYTVYAPKKGLVSIIFSGWLNTGKAHGDYWDKPIGTFDLKNNTMVSIKDVFSGESPDPENLAHAIRTGMKAPEAAWLGVKIQDTTIDQSDCILTDTGAIFLNQELPVEMREYTEISVKKEELIKIDANPSFWE